LFDALSTHFANSFADEISTFLDIHFGQGTGQ